jgi:hypothetical protein
MARWESVGIGAAIVAIVCCAGVPLVASAVGGVALTTLLGVGGAILAVALVGAALAVRRRRRNAARATRNLHEGDRR